MAEDTPSPPENGSEEERENHVPIEGEAIDPVDKQQQQEDESLSQQQTRFNFYEPVDAPADGLIPKIDDAGGDSQPKVPTRFNFYNAEEVHKSHPLHLPEPIDLTKLEISNTEIGDTNKKKEVDSQEILASLQETERERERCLNDEDHDGNNPYLNAIHDALDMLRNNRGGIEAADAEALLSTCTPAPSEVGVATIADDHSLVSSVAVDEEVQKGVERVLEAILQRASSTSKRREQPTVGTTQQNSAPSISSQPISVSGDEQLSHQSTPRMQGPSRRMVEEYLTDNDDDDEEDEEENDDDFQEDASNTKKPSSVVDELLAENDDRPYEDDTGLLINTSTSLTQVLGPLSGNNTTGVVLETTVDDGIPGSDDDNDDETTEQEENEVDVEGNNNEEETETETETENGEVDESENTEVDDDAPISEAPSSILESLSTAVKDAESFMSFVTGAMSGEQDSLVRREKDRYSMEQEEEDDDDDDDAEAAESFDDEANELMRSLCAHLLPFGVDKSTKHLSEIPPWDDSDANEPGYRIIRLSKSQLRRVEREFERMVNGVKRNSERNLGIVKHLSEKDVTEAWNGASSSSYDQRFEKDLEEAEQALDREEQLLAASVKAAEAKLVEVDDTDDEEADVDLKVSTEEDGNDEEDESEADDAENLGAHPAFPGVKPTGRGEMGDLEYFNLPIIYKSHVTGFEPTKDMFLEPGNIVAGQFLVENELGSAAFSTAYRCIDLNSDATGDGDYHDEVCLKVIKNTKDFFDQSLDEIKILEMLRQTGKCQENNIVEMKTFFYHREHLVIVTELLRQNLFEFGKFILENNEEPYFTRRRLCYITRQCLIALDFVHSLGLIHSDVKPENILLASYSRAKVKLIDFGSSCYGTDRQSSYIQSRSYRAPEVVLGLPYDGKIDVWSLGCVVAEMYTGEVTFQNDSIVSMLSRIEAICGPFPRHMIAQGRQSTRFFTKSGLLYELVDGDERRTNPVMDEDEAGLFDVFQPKRSTYASRLGYDPEKLANPQTPESKDAALFVDFCKSVLTIDPDSRPSAAEALKHPWIVSGETLTEEEIKYPSQ